MFLKVWEAMNIVLEGHVEAFGSSRAHASSFLCWYVNFPPSFANPSPKKREFIT